MILKISLRAKAGVPKTLVKQNLRQHSLYLVQNTLMFTESRGKFRDLHSILKCLYGQHSRVFIVMVALYCVKRYSKKKNWILRF